jgi:hypothetical protein
MGTQKVELKFTYRERKLEIARRSKIIEELNSLRPFRCENTKNLPKDYKDPVRGFTERCEKFKQSKSAIMKPPTGRPNIDKKSRKMAEKIIDKSLDKWDRMYRGGSLTRLEPKNNPESNISEFLKPSIPKVSSQRCISA